MAHDSRYFLMVTGMLALLLFIPTAVCAQPIGLLSPQPKQQTQRGLLATENGRFAFGQISDSSKDKFMLDTLTGRLWRIAESGEIGLYLTVVPYRTKKGEYTDLPEGIPGSALKETGKK